MLEFKLVDCDELGYRETDKPYPRGEVAARTQDMSSGYYKNEAANISSYTPGIPK
jgi:long-subunit acyl-CoA synthetase (AMP-forming)